MSYDGDGRRRGGERHANGDNDGGHPGAEQRRPVSKPGRDVPDEDHEKRKRGEGNEPVQGARPRHDVGRNVLLEHRERCGAEEATGGSDRSLRRR